MRRTKIEVALFSLFFVVMLVLAGSMHLALAAEKVLKVGTTLPLSGPAAAWGLPMTRMVDFFAEDVNAKGGLKIGKDTYKIKTIFYDNKGQTSEAAACATKLVYDDKIQYLVGGVIAATGMAEIPITNSAKVVTWGCWWGKAILGPDKPFVFRQTVSYVEARACPIRLVCQKPAQDKEGSPDRAE